MKSLSALALLLILIPAIVAAQAPPGCSWEGDPAFRFGWGATYAGWTGYTPPPGHYHQPGYDTVWAYGTALAYKLGPYNAAANWQPTICKAGDTLCFEIQDARGWTITCTPAAGTPYVLSGPGYLWTQNVVIYVPCSAEIGSSDRIIATVAYVNSAGTCDTSCGDCVDPDLRPADGKYYYSKDTLFVIAGSPDLPPPVVLQDTLSYVEFGQRQAYVPFSICNNDPCYPMDVGCHIWSMGHVGSAISTYDTVTVPSGRCADVFGLIDAGSGDAGVYDTLHIIAWTCRPSPPYDTCVQLVCTVTLCGNCAVPVFALPVTMVLVLVLIFAATVFIRRRTVDRA